MIRRAHINDAQALAHMAEHAFRETFTADNNATDMEAYCAKAFGAEIQRQEIQDPNCATLLVEKEGELVAFAQIRLHAPKDCVPADHPSELHRLYVVKAWHGRGVAQKVMTEALSTAVNAGADHVWLGVWEHNPRAIAFYNKYGFKVVGEHTFQFGSDPQRDLVMMTAVDPSLFV